MRVLVTGASGFLGSYLVKELLTTGHTVAVLLRDRSAAWRLSETLSQITIITGSLDDVAALQAPLAALQPDAVAHLAWRGVGNMERNAPVQAQNVPDCVELCAIAADVGAKIFVGAGSQAEYGPHNQVISETSSTNPTTLYGKAKLAAGSMASQIAEERGLRFAWLRIFSTYGPGDADYWLIPSMIKTLRAREAMSLTRCEQVWSFLHAADAARGFATVLGNPEGRGIFNLGHPEAPRLRDTVVQIRDLVSPDAELRFGEVPYRADQVMILKPDVSRLIGLGWTPQMDFVTGLKQMVRWYDTAQQH